jgi:hypothetical protein
VRLVVYLEAVTEDRLAIDLITVSLYRVGDSEVIVPQRVDPERRAVDLPAPRPRTPTWGVLAEDVTEFDASIDAAREDQRHALRRLRDWAAALRDEGSVTLHTYHGSLATRWTPLPRLPGENVGLVTVYNENGAAVLQLFRSVYERLAPRDSPPCRERGVPGHRGPGQHRPGRQR